VVDHGGQNDNRSQIKKSGYDAPKVLPSVTHLAETSIDMTASLRALSAGPAAADCCAPSAGLDPGLDAERIAVVAKALAEPLRVQILDLLRRSDQEVCQCELIPLFGITQPLLSHHIRKLVDAGLVSVERRHKWAYYTVNPDALKELTSWLS
jgi:ArsR family transcriptional regulator, arsenate/arsenite/antimonite-responsive transcriptional repressor